jgi:hypothetical protein
MLKKVKDQSDYEKVRNMEDVSIIGVILDKAQPAFKKRASFAHHSARLDEFPKWYEGGLSPFSGNRKNPIFLGRHFRLSLLVPRQGGALKQAAPSGAQTGFLDSIIT